MPMQNKNKATIAGIGSYLPKKILTNEDLEKIVDTSDEWIVSRTGMKERRIAASDEYTSDMGYQSALKALENAAVTPDEIDCIIVATLTPDYPFPSTACIIQQKLGASKAAAFDIQAACTGYLYGLQIAKNFVESGVYKNILLVTSEKLSSIVNYEDRSTCVLFGDGASSCVIRCGGKGLLIEEVVLGADGEQGHLLMMPGGGSRNPATEETVAQKLHYIHMSGNEVFKHAVRRMETSSKNCLEKLGLSEKDISWIIPHQANIRIIDAIAKRFTHLSSDHIFRTVHKYGNTSCTSVGIALDELLSHKTVEKGQRILLTAFGAGFTWGSAVLTMSQGE
jgi:3-oxoacyl-[acyl-carrier-protein] synthase III